MTNDKPMTPEQLNQLIKDVTGRTERRMRNPRYRQSGLDDKAVTSSKREDRADLPELSLDNDPVAVAKELAKLIAARRDVLLNGYTPVRIIAEPGQAPYASELTSEAVRAYAFEICRCIKNGDDAPLPKDVAQLYLHGLEGQWGLRPFNGISTAPLLGSDGGIRSANGYDEE